MADLVRRYEQITYTGANGAAVLDFFSSVNGPVASWTIDSQSDELLVLKCDFPNVDGSPSPPPYLVEIPNGAVFTRTPGIGGNDSVQGPWSLEEISARFASVPTMAEFQALETLVAALEPPTTEQESL